MHQRKSLLFASSNQEDEEFYPSDPACTTPQLLSSLWLQIAQGCKNLSKGVRFLFLQCRLLLFFLSFYFKDASNVF